MKRLVLLLCTVAVVYPTRAWAVNTTINSAVPLAFGQVFTQAVTAGTPAYFSFEARSGRSYSALCLATFEGAATPFSESAACGNFELRNAADVVLTSGIAFGGDIHFPGGESFGHVATATGWNFVRVFSGFTTTVRVVVFDTTLYSPWFFVNTASGYDAYVEIRNTTSQSVSVTVTAQAANGTTVGTPVTRTVPGDGGTVVVIGLDMGIMSGSGSVRIAHNTNPGGLIANVTTISGVTGLSFDAPAAPRMTWATFQ